jgi:hypothetical protein
MTRLPVPGSDSGQWGDILNNYLSQSHNSDGSLKAISETNITNLQTDLAAKANTTDLAPVATTGSYTDLANKPTISTGIDASLLTTGTVADARLPVTAQATSLAPAVALAAAVTATGRSVLTAADAATARTSIGAGTSSLMIGTVAGTAADAAALAAVAGVANAALPTTSVPTAVAGEITNPASATGVALAADYAMQTGGIRKVTGPTLPTFTTGTKYVWEKTDATTGALVDIVTGVEA